MSFSRQELEDAALGAAFAKAIWINRIMANNKTNPPIYSLTLMQLGQTKDGKGWAASFDLGVEDRPEWYELSNIENWPTAYRGRTPAQAIEGAAAKAMIILSKHGLLHTNPLIRINV